MLLAYEDYGPGPVVVLLHGFPLDRTMWASQITTLGSMYRIIAPDLRGHGKSAAPEGVYTVDEMADDVLELLDALQIAGPIVLCGHSMGGYIALSIMARRPERARGLILVDTRATADTPQSAKLRHKLADQVDREGNVESVVAVMIPGLFSPTALQRRANVVVRTEEQMKASSTRGVAGTLRGLAVRPDRSAVLAGIRVPTLILVGVDDQITPPAEARRMAEAVPGAELVEVPDAGHLAPVENPAVVNDAILRFLRSLP